MIISSNTYRILPGYIPDTQVAVTWSKRLLDGNYLARNRNPNNDVYDSHIIVQGTEAETRQLMIDLQLGRGQIDLTFNEGEEIFGADIDHLSGFISCMVMKVGETKRDNLIMYSVPLHLRLVDPVANWKSGLTLSFDELRVKNLNAVTNTSWDYMVTSTYAGVLTVVDQKTDIGTFKCRFWQTGSEMANIRGHLVRNVRGEAITLPAAVLGLNYYWGPAQDIETDIYFRVISWKDLGQSSFDNWGLDMTFAQVR
jgi:hypothetical protein